MILMEIEVNDRLPQEGEEISFYGGKGNKLIKQMKCEKGIYYIRNSFKEEWVILIVRNE
jgi:hypothetical protein